MPSLSFEVGAVFLIDAQPAITSLEAIGTAFSGLETMLKESVAATASAVNQMVTEIGRLADAWRAVGAAARSGTPGAPGQGGGRGSTVLPGGGGRGPGGGVVPGGRGQAARQMDEDRRNAEWENSNRDQIYRRQEAEARRENEAFDRRARDGRIGPPPRPLWGEGDDWANAREENARVDAAEAAARRRAAAAGRNGFFAGLRGGPGMAGMVGAFTGFEAEKHAMQEDRALAQALQEMGYDPRESGFQLKMDQLRLKVAGATAGTIYSEAHGASVLPGTAGQFSGLFNTPDTRREAYEAVLPSALKFAEVAEQYHRGTIGESYKAGIGYLAMTNQTTEKSANLGLSQLLALSLATGDTIAQEQNVLKYSLPIGKAAGADPVEVAALTGFMEILGFRGTTAGTGVGQMIMGLTGTGGPVAAQKHRAHDMGRAFENILHLKPEEMHAVRKSRGSEHDIALRELGLLDPKTGRISEQVAPGGHLNVSSLIEHIGTSLQTMNPMRGLEALRNAFTVRGSREAAELKDPETVKRLLDFFAAQKNPPSIDELQKQLATRPLQQFEQMLANLANTGNILATQTLNGLNTAFMKMNQYIVGFNEFLRTHQGVAEVGGYAGLTVAGAAGLGVLGWSLSKLWQVTGAPLVAGGKWLFGSGAAGEAAAGLGPGTAATLGGAAGAGALGLGAVYGAGLYEAPRAAAGGLMDMIFGRGSTARDERVISQGAPSWLPTWLGGRQTLQPGDPGYIGPGALLPGPRVGLPPTGTPPVAAAVTPPVVNQTNHVTLNATALEPSVMQKIIDYITKGLSEALSHSTSDGAGVGTSQYTHPGP